MGVGAAAGAAAASDPELLRTVLEKGPKIQYFELDRCLNAAALECDRLRRKKDKPHLLKRPQDAS